MKRTQPKSKPPGKKKNEQKKPAVTRATLFPREAADDNSVGDGDGSYDDDEWDRLKQLYKVGELIAPITDGKKTTYSVHAQRQRLAESLERTVWVPHRAAIAASLVTQKPPIGFIATASATTAHHMSGSPLYKTMRTTMTTVHASLFGITGYHGGSAHERQLAASCTWNRHLPEAERTPMTCMDVVRLFSSLFGILFCGIAIPLQEEGGGGAPGSALFVFEWQEQTGRAPGGGGVAGAAGLSQNKTAVANGTMVFGVICRLTPATLADVSALLVQEGGGGGGGGGLAPASSPPVCELLPRLWLMYGEEGGVGAGAGATTGERQPARALVKSSSFEATGCTFETTLLVKDKARFYYENYCFMEPDIAGMTLALRY